MTRISYINGKFTSHKQAFVHIEDRGFQFADGVYEVILFYKNKLIDFEEHIARLFASLNIIKIKFTLTQEQIKQIILELLAKNNLVTGSVYLQVTRGVSPRSQLVPENVVPTFIVTVSPLQSQFFLSDELKGVTVTIAEDMRWQYCNVKSIGLLASSMAKQKSIDLGFNDVILLRENYITEASFSNVFIVNKEGNLITRDVDNFILAGITRDRLIKLAQTNGIKVSLRKFDQEELISANEVFLTASTLIISPVIAINNLPIGNGKVGVITNKLAKLYRQFLEQ